jgi:hypothetical protein
MLSLDIIDELDIVVHRYKDIVTARKLGGAWNALMKLEAFTEKGYDLISNYGKAKFDFRLEDLEVAKKFLRKYRMKLSGKKEAIITDNPYTTALCMLFKQHAQNEAGLQVRIFSTEQAAIKWIIQCAKPCYCSIEKCIDQKGKCT